MLSVRGVGERKLADLGERFIAHITTHCREHDLSVETSVPVPVIRAPTTARPNEAKQRAFEMFAAGESVEAVGAALARAPSTVWAYLEEYVMMQPPVALDAWVEAAAQARVLNAIAEVGNSYLKPIFEHLHGSVPYEHIRLVVAHQRGQRSPDNPHEAEPA